MRLKKAERDQVRRMFDGRCAYCGCQLGDTWHADHVEPVYRQFWLGKKTSLAPENHRLDNFMPACPPCNISKGQMGIEAWRDWLAGHVSSLNRHHPIYRMTKAFGLVEETGRPVVFYFEKQSGSVAEGNLDGGVPNHFDQNKRGFSP